ncbi:NCS1 family nucleobase:cation symporter-1 [Actinopolymorpha sp. B9G3]|uniref:NCS1 family nucleobase:cation symporter-1 n=1 Tax=Actinopolymorpha sp. B9G3 TaxID=3158970 RepID=UPI0032D96CE4
MTATRESQEQVVHHDGRIDLRDPSAIVASRYANAELAPTPTKDRRWTTYNYTALWMGMAHNIPAYLLASGLVAIGMNWLQAFVTITLANLIVLVPMLLNSHAGTKYGIPFPVFARAFYGVRGANLPALLRAFIACGWFGIQTWIGGQAIFVIVGKLAGVAWIEATALAGQPWTLWLSFGFFWAVQMVLIARGIDGLRRFENWAAPLVTVAFLALLVYMVMEADGFGPIFSQPSQLGWGVDFWTVFWPSLMGMIAFWATLSLNMPDFTRFSGGQRQQAIGQVLGLPTTMAFISIVSIMITSATIVVYGEAVWDPVEVARRFDHPVIVIIGLAMAILATMSCNVAANVVSPSYDFSNALPRWLTFRTAGLLTGVIGILIQPWRLISDPNVYIFAWLGFYGGVLASVAGVLIAGYWIVDRTTIALGDLYRVGGRYWYTAGWNWRAVVATVVGAVLAVGGAYSAPGKGPFPADGLLPWLRPLYDYSWAVGLAAGLIIYVALSATRPASSTRAASSHTKGTGSV